jgi:hypothetical protein
MHTKEKVTPSRDDGKKHAAKPTKNAVQSFPDKGVDLTDRFEQTKRSVSEHGGLPSNFQPTSFSASEGLSSILADDERKPPAKKARASESLLARMNYHTPDKNTKGPSQLIWKTTAVNDFRPNLHDDYVFDEQAIERVTDPIPPSTIAHSKDLVKSFQMAPESSKTDEY